MAALLFIDSFGHYTTLGQMTTKWTSAVGSGSILTGIPQTGSGQAFKGTAHKTLGPYQTLCQGARYKLGTPSDNNYVGFQNNAVVLGAFFDIISDGRLRFTGNFQSGFHTEPPSAFAISFGSIYYIDCYCNIAPFLAGNMVNQYKITYTYDMHVNGVSRYSGSFTSGLCGFTSSVITIANVVFAEIISNGDNTNGWVGDLYVTDGEIIGDVSIVPLFPRANGTTIQWTPLSAPNFSQVNEHSPDDNTSYNSDSNVGDIDQYYMDLIGAGFNIKGAQGVWRVENDLAGATQVKGRYINGALTVVKTSAFAPSQDTYQYFLDTRRKSVFTGIDWTQAEIDASQTGIEKSA